MTTADRDRGTALGTDRASSAPNVGSDAAAAWLGISKRMLYTLCDRGELTFHVFARRLKFSDRDLQAFAAAHRHQASS